MISQTETLARRTFARQRTPITRVMRAYIIVMLPVLLVLVSVRVVMSPAFLYFEYNRPDFPPDAYGFTREDRLYYGPYAVDYLLNDAGIEYLANLQFANGSSLFNPRELRHMADVKLVTRAANFVLLIGGTLYLVAVAVPLWTPHTRRELFSALLSGGLLTLGLVAGIIAAAVFAWDAFFTTFHQLLFADGTWIFLYSDTLIRLFPEQFWFDASLVVGVLTIGGAAFISITSFIGLRRGL